VVTRDFRANEKFPGDITVTKNHFQTIRCGLSGFVPVVDRQ
jgi:hypothetical protein